MKRYILWDPMREDAACCVLTIRAIKNGWRHCANRENTFSIASKCMSCGKTWSLAGLRYRPVAVVEEG